MRNIIIDEPHWGTELFRSHHYIISHRLRYRTYSLIGQSMRFNILKLLQNLGIRVNARKFSLGCLKLS